MSAEVSSGLVAANSIPIGPASYAVMMAARSDPTESITHSSSSTNDSHGGSWAMSSGSDAPGPRGPKRISRENDASRRKNSSATGSSQSVSNAPQLPAVSTRSMGPSPTTS